MSFTLCVFDINETDDNVDNTAVLRTPSKKKKKSIQARRITATFHTPDSLSIIGWLISITQFVGMKTFFSSFYRFHFNSSFTFQHVDIVHRFIEKVHAAQITPNIDNTYTYKHLLRLLLVMIHMAVVITNERWNVSCWYCFCLNVSMIHLTMVFSMARIRNREIQFSHSISNPSRKEKRYGNQEIPTHLPSARAFSWFTLSSLWINYSTWTN